MDQQPRTRVIREPDVITSRLTELGLTLSLLDDVRQAWASAHAGTSPFEPINASGMKGWMASVGALREALVLQEWEAVDYRCWPLIVAPNKSMAITMTSGDLSTGVADARPTTKNPKGILTANAVRRNFEQMGIDFGPGYQVPKMLKPRRAKSAPLTWLFMVRMTPDDVRAELSLPAAIENKYIVAWHERIVLEPMPRISPPGARRHVPDFSELEEIDVPVVRK